MVNNALDRERGVSDRLLEYDPIKENPSPAHPPRSAAPGVPRRQYFIQGQKWIHEGFNNESLESPYGNDDTVEH